MECLPTDVIVDILSRLPVESVLDCKLVSKRWLNLLNNRRDQFAKMHHQHQLLQLASSSTGLLFSFETQEDEGVRLCYIDKYNDEMNIHENYSYETLQKTSFSYPHMTGCHGIVGSCNGLICLIRYHHEFGTTIHICNPNTGEYVDLPEYTKPDKKDYVGAFGFGYVHLMTNYQYKVVRICYPLYPNLDGEYENGEVQVYTIGSGSGWRTIGTTSYQLSESAMGTCVNGSLHWIDDNINKIVAFNLADEEFRLVQPLPCYDPPHNCYYCLDMVQALSGNLCLAHRNNQEHLLDIWSLKKNATEEKWSRDFTIAYNSAWKNEFGGCSIRPLLITKKSEVLFVHQDSTLYRYDPKTKTVSKLWNDDEKSEIIARLTAVPHMNSFVSLKALGERSESKKNAIEGSLEDPVY